MLGKACRGLNKRVVVSKTNKVQKRSLQTKGGRKRVVTLIPGDGIGPEITASTLGILQAAGAPVEFERFDEIGDNLPVEMLTRYALFPPLRLLFYHLPTTDTDSIALGRHKSRFSKIARYHPSSATNNSGLRSSLVKIDAFYAESRSVSESEPFGSRNGGQNTKRPASD